MELYPHNELAYTKLKESLVYNKRACVIQPTGTGKSFVIAKFIFEHSDKRFLCLTANNYIVEQFDLKFKNVLSNYVFYNYPTLISKQFNELIKDNFDYIVLDEFHRAGAEEWGEKLNELIEFFHSAKLIGLTATHIRNEVVDGGVVRNMAEELFFGNIVHHLSLREAFDVGILPTPKYVKALYDLGNEYDIIIAKINNSSIKNKAQLRKYALEKKVFWDNSYGVDKILKKHITSERNFIVFCKNIDHLEEVKQTVEGWFKNAFNKTVNSFKMYSTFTNSQDELSSFKICATSKKKEINLLFVVQQLNEGLHIDNIDGVLFLRPTDSHIIYYQQLGRCLQTKGKQPLVFDMVNNFKTTSKQHDIFKEEYEAVIKEDYIKADYKKYQFKFNVIDEVADYRDLFSYIENKLSPWMLSFESFKNLLKDKGWDNLSNDEKHWIYIQRIFYMKKKYLNPERIELLNTLIPLIGFDWKQLSNNIDWEKNYNRFKELLKKKGWKNLSREEKVWFEHQKYYFNKKKLDNFRINELNKLNVLLGFDWKHGVFLSSWKKKFSRFKSLLSSEGWNNLSKKDKNWLKYQKIALDKNKLSKEKIELLDTLNHLLDFDWKINQNNSFIQSYNNFRNLLRDKGWNNLSYDEKKWFYQVKNQFKNGRLDSIYISKLDKLNVLLGFNWNTNIKELLWLENYNRFKELLKKKGWKNLSREEKVWFKDCKRNYLKNKLSKEKIELLENLNVFLGANWSTSSKNYK